MNINNRLILIHTSVYLFTDFIYLSKKKKLEKERYLATNFTTDSFRFS